MKKIVVNVKPNSSKNEIIKITDLVYKAKVTASPVRGEANALLIKLMAKHLGVAKSQVEIKSGKSSRSKVLNVFL